MATVKDILMDKDFDLIIKDGDIVIGESTDQHIRCLMLAEKGSYKQFPDVGVGLQQYLNGELDLEQLSTRVNEELENDGMRVEILKIPSIEQLQVEAYYQQSESEE